MLELLLVVNNLVTLWVFFVIIKQNLLFFLRVCIILPDYSICKFIVDNIKYSELNHDEILWMVDRQPEIMS